MVRETIEEGIVSYAVSAGAGPENQQRSPPVPEKILQAAVLAHGACAHHRTLFLRRVLEKDTN